MSQHLLIRRYSTSCLTLAATLVAILACLGTPARADDQPTKAGSETTHWYAMFMQGKRVGYTRGIEKTIEQNGQERVSLDAQMVMKMARFGATIETKMDIRTVEDKQGKLYSFETAMTAGQATLSSTGIVKDGKLEMTLSTLGQETKETLDWTGEARGFFGRESSLQAKPMQPGEERTVKMLAPMSTSLAEVQLKATGYVETEMLTGKRKLLKIESLTISDAGGQKVQIQETLYTDSAGVLIKSELPMMQQVMYRTTREVALGDFDPQGVDLGKLSIVEAKAPADLVTRDSARYRVTFKSGDPSESFPSGGVQTVKKIDDSTAEITVAPGTGVNNGDQPTKEDRVANGMIQSDDAKIKRLAAQIAPQEKDAVRLAKAIEKHVHDVIEEKNFSQVFASAAEVAEQLQGDCTEHAVLLAAIARARDLPARVVMGLIYVPQLGGFGYHMWSEVWTGNRWLPLDGTLGRGGITPGHIKIVHANLKGAGPLAATLPVMNVMGNVSIEVLP